MHTLSHKQEMGKSLSDKDGERNKNLTEVGTLLYSILKKEKKIAWKCTCRQVHLTLPPVGGAVLLSIVQRE